MVVGPDVRAARTADPDEIDALLRAVFGRADEANLACRLRADGDMWAEMVTRWDGVIAAYAALGRMRAPRGWACLAPLAVLPRFQNAAAAPPGMRGASEFRFGTCLAQYPVLIGTEAWRRDRWGGRFPAAIVVLGSVPFYERVRFSAARAANLRSPYPIESTLLAAPPATMPPRRRWCIPRPSARCERQRASP